MLAAQGMGLGTCCIGFARPWLSLAATKAELGIPPAYAPITPIVVGHPKSGAPAVLRKRPEVHWVRPAASITSTPSSVGASNLSAAMKSEFDQSPEPEFDEPAVSQYREDPGADVAPSRFDIQSTLAPLPPAPHPPRAAACLTRTDRRLFDAMR